MGDLHISVGGLDMEGTTRFLGKVRSLVAAVAVTLVVVVVVAAIMVVLIVVVVALLCSCHNLNSCHKPHNTNDCLVVMSTSSALSV